MALTASETFGTIVPGFVTDTNGNLSCTGTVSGSSWREGFLRDTDGRLVVTDSATGATWQNGFLRGTSGELVYTLNSGDYGVVPGFKTATNGALCFSVEPSSQAWQNGFLVSTSGYLAATGVTPYAVAVRALSPSFFLSLGSQTGLTDLSGNGRNGTGAGSITIGSQTGPLVRGDSGATLFDGTDDRITTTYGTRRNHLVNPSFETNITGVQNSTCTTAQSSVQAYDGTSSCQVTSTGANSSPNANASQGNVAAAGITYTFSAYVFHTVAGRTGRADLRFYDSGGTIIGGGSTGTNTALTQDAWTRVSVTATAPAGTAFVGWIVRCDVLAVGSSGEVSYIDGLLIEAAASAGTFFPTVAQLDSGEAGWLGTAHASASDIGCFANGTTRTFMGWANRANSSAAHILIGSSDGSVLLRLESGSNNVAFWPYSGSGPTTWTAAWPGNNQWVHWALVFDEAANTAALYINGALVSSQTNTVQYNFAANPTFEIACRNFQNYFSGNLAWQSVHLRALTADEIAGVYAAK